MLLPFFKIIIRIHYDTHLCSDAGKARTFSTVSTNYRVEKRYHAASKPPQHFLTLGSNQKQEAPVLLDYTKVIHV